MRYSIERVIGLSKFLKRAAVIASLVVLSSVTGAAWQSQYGPPALAGQVETLSQRARAGTWTQGVAADFRSGQFLALTVRESPDRMTLDSGARIGSYLSVAQATDFPFNAVAASWRANLPLGSNLALEVRASNNGATWSDWVRMSVVDQFAGYDVNVSDLILVHGSYLQFRVTMARNEGGLSPELNEVTLTYIDSAG